MTAVSEQWSIVDSQKVAEVCWSGQTDYLGRSGQTWFRNKAYDTNIL